MRDNILRSNLFNFFSDIGRTYLLMDDSEIENCKKIIEESGSQYIEIIPPSIKLSGPISSDGGTLVEIGKIKLFFARTECNSKREFQIEQLEKRGNPLYIFNDEEMYILQPFLFVREMKYGTKYLLYSDLNVNLKFNNLFWESIIEFKIDDSLISIANQMKDVALFPSVSSDKLNVINIRTEINRISNGIHSIRKNDVYNYKINGTMLLYSILKVYKSYQSNEFGMIDLKTQKLIFSKFQKSEKRGEEFIQSHNQFFKYLETKGVIN